MWKQTSEGTKTPRYPNDTQHKKSYPKDDDLIAQRFGFIRKKWCPGAESNHRHEDFQSTALPLSYPGTGDGRAVRVAMS